MSGQNEIKCILLLVLTTVMLSCDKNSGGSNEEKPGMSINDISIAEGNTGTTAFGFDITLSKTFSQAVTVNYRTVEGTAKSTTDFTAIADASITFQAGETKKTIVVQVVSDDLRENDEVFTVRLSNAGNANLTRETGTGTIRNDDTRINIPSGGYEAPAGYPGYTLSWMDDFSGNTLDAGSWTYETGDGCPNLCGWGNNELQFYTNSPENLFFQDGKLVIQAKQESYSGRNYTSARIKTEGKKHFKFGRIDVRASLPEGKGIWPAFWLLPQSNVYGGWPRSGEIDLMEYLGHETNKVYGTLHYGPGPGSTNISRSYVLPSGTFSNQFNVFSIEWKQDEIKWFVDGNLYATLTKTDVGTNYPFNENFFLIINMAVGGNWPGAPDASTSFPQFLVVDYVKVFQ
jgi:hypothetical protein